ncbi:Gibberellin-regulated protein 7-like protein [Drosera capensis]
MKLVFSTLLLIALVCSSTCFTSTALPDADAAAPGSVPNGFCGPRCGERCAKAGVKDRCLKYCGICCQQCQCVPSGTFGNKSQCPCYMNKKNSKGEPKCP